jgi:hypothetical protein
MTDYKTPATIDGNNGEVLPTPQEIKLKTANDIRLEMARVYRDMRQGRIDTSDGTKLTYVLTGLLKAIETGLLESRMNALERALKDK